MTDSKQAPQIRFKGFADPWEQRKLDSIYEYGGSGGTPSATNTEYYGGDIRFLSISDIGGRFIEDTAKTLTAKGLKNSAASIFPAGSICLAMYASIGKVGINLHELATSQAFYNMVFSNTNLRDFVYSRLTKADHANEWDSLVSTGTQRNLNALKVKEWGIGVPCEAEYTSVSLFFLKVDNLITLHQRESKYR